MPKLACRVCGRQLYTAVALESLAAHERRCPRCGAYLALERRVIERRAGDRRRNASGDPGPPRGMAERRGADRRAAERRRGQWPIAGTGGWRAG
jgi:hypothetical protein